MVTISRQANEDIYRVKFCIIGLEFTGRFEVLLNTDLFNAKRQELDSFNQSKSAARFCHRVAAFPDMFCNFYLVKNHKIANHSTNTKVNKNKR